MSSLAIARATFTVALLLCVAAPPTHSGRGDDEQGLLMMSDRSELGIRMSNRNIDDPELTAYLHEVACRVASEHCGELRVYVVRAANFNAFMMPNGAMFVHSGLLLRLDSEAELAAILGHEASHFVRDHSINRWRKAKRSSSTMAFLGAVVQAGSATSRASTGSEGGWATASNAVALAQVASIYQLFAYNRSQEREADMDGIGWMASGGYDASGASSVWNKLIREQEAANDGGGGFNLLATHPAPKQRMRYLAEAAEELPSVARAARPQVPFTTRFDSYREEWLTDEMVAGIHPARFAAVAAEQRRLGFSEGLSAYMEARAWLNHARRGPSGEQRGAVAQALSAFQRGAATEGGMPARAHREWGRALLMQRKPDLNEAQSRFNRYFDLRPDAQDRQAIMSMMERRIAKQR